MPNEIKPSNKTKIIIDATNQSWGRVASKVASVLQNKISPDYAPNKINTPNVIVENFSKIKFTGKKLKQKMYRRHTAYLGHLKEESLEFKLQKNPEKAFKETVKKMLPKNSLRDKRLKNLIIKF